MDGSWVGCPLVTMSPLPLTTSDTHMCRLRVRVPGMRVYRRARGDVSKTDDPFH